MRGIGTRVYWVQTGGFDTHASQGNAGGGAYANLMATVERRPVRVLHRPAQPGTARRHARPPVLRVRPPHPGERQPGHRSRRRGRDDGDRRSASAAASTARAASLDPDPGNPTLENNGGDVRYETDFRSVYARVLDDWLGANSESILGGNFRAAPRLSSRDDDQCDCVAAARRRGPSCWIPLRPGPSSRIRDEADDCGTRPRSSARS